MTARETQAAFDSKLAALNQRMLGELPSSLEEAQALVQSICASSSSERAALLKRLEISAHRLRGRAAMLQLGGLADAAAWLEGSAQSGAEAQQLRSAVSACAASYAACVRAKAR